MAGNSGMMAEVAEVNELAKNQAQTGEEMELPVGGVVDEPAVEAAAEPDAEAAPVASAPVEIRIGDQLFSSHADAMKYAETLANDKLINESYQMGVRDSMKTQAQDVAPVVEENFEEKFYSDPKGTLKSIEDTAVQKALNTIRAEQNRENLWKLFFDENPDLSGHRSICEHVLSQNMEVLGPMQDLDKARKILATKTRSVFQAYNEAAKPRTELQRKSSQAVSTGGSNNPGVTQIKKVERVLTMAEQMRSLKGQ